MKGENKRKKKKKRFPGKKDKKNIFFLNSTEPSDLL